MGGTKIDAGMKPRVVRKVALRLVPFLCLLYFVNYLDRVNIGFAGPNGLTDELKLSATAFGFASGIFFIGYLLLEVPSNLALHRFGARRWIARIMITWGLVATLTAFAPNGPILMVLRFLLGVAEAGFFPGVIFYLTLWFPASERAKVVSMFMAAIPVSTAVGSVLSSAIIGGLHGAFGLSGWRMMFLVEGIPALLLAVAVWFYLTDRPDQAKWLDDDERTWLTTTLADEGRQRERAHPWTLRRALLSPRMLALAFVYFGTTYGGYALTFFLPTIVDGFKAQFGLHMSIVQAGLITAIPYAVGAVVMIVWGRHGDRRQERVWHVAGPLILAGVSIPIALYLGSPILVMGAVTLTAIGYFAGLPTFWALPSTFLTGAAAAGGIALINSLGNVSGFAAPYITGWLTDLTGSERAGLWVAGACMLAAALVTIALGAAPRPEPEPVSEEGEPG
ncbi:MAG TPA: MFS transporter [Streptosporangiaceae bacterium]|jgi:MFS family permease